MCYSCTVKAGVALSAKAKVGTKAVVEVPTAVSLRIVELTLAIFHCLLWELDPHCCIPRSRGSELGGERAGSRRRNDGSGSSRPKLSPPDPSRRECDRDRPLSARGDLLPTL